MRAVLRNNGLALVEIEFLAGWALNAGQTGGISPSLAGIEAVADALGGRQVSAGEFSGDIPLDTEEALERAAKALRANADRLAEKGLLVALESFPWSALANTRIAIDLLRRADAPNAGLLIDVWHFYNGGGHPDQLADLPSAGITGVQLNDGPLVHENFLQHARAERQLPGEGELDVVGLIHAVRRAGFTGPYCVESNTPEFRNLPVAEAARRAADAATACCARPASWPDDGPAAGRPASTVTGRNHGDISKAGDGAANAGTWGPPGSPSVRRLLGASVRHSRV